MHVCKYAILKFAEQNRYMFDRKFAHHFFHNAQCALKTLKGSF
jgi:hypothetical protein